MAIDVTTSPKKVDPEYLMNKWNDRYGKQVVRKNSNDKSITIEDISKRIAKRKKNQRATHLSLNFHDGLNKFFDADIAEFAVNKARECEVNPLFMNTKKLETDTVDH